MGVPPGNDALCCGRPDPGQGFQLRLGRQRQTDQLALGASLGSFVTESGDDDLFPIKNDASKVYPLEASVWSGPTSFFQGINNS
jgi:hypothetical protein